MLNSISGQSEGVLSQDGDVFSRFCCEATWVAGTAPEFSVRKLGGEIFWSVGMEFRCWQYVMLGCGAGGLEKPRWMGCNVEGN